MEWKGATLSSVTRNRIKPFARGRRMITTTGVGGRWKTDLLTLAKKQLFLLKPGLNGGALIFFLSLSSFSASTTVCQRCR